MTSEDMQICDLTKDYFEFRKVLNSRDTPVRFLTCGSFFEMPILYFLSNPTDIDAMYCDMTFCAIYDHVKIPERLARNVLIIETKDCHAGFARLRHGVQYFRKHNVMYKHDMEKGPAYTYQLSIGTTYLRAVLGKIYPRWKNICNLSKDDVYSLSCPLGPPDAHDWITHKRINGWPSTDTINAIVKSGCHLVSKPHAKNPNDDTQWRYSFSQAETVLIHNNWTDVQKYIYHLLRIIKRDVVSRCGGKDKTFISNYYIKTSMLWKCEEKPSSFWEERNIVTSTRELLLGFIQQLIERNIPHYFMPANNIMDDLPCNPNVENEVLLLLYYREEEIFDLVRKEPKAYHMTPGFIAISNECIFPLATMLSSRPIAESIIESGCLQQSLFNNYCGYNNFFPELEYLHRGIIIHLQMSNLSSCENRQYRQDHFMLAKELFGLSIHKLDYGLTRIRFNIGWSLFELLRQLLVFRTDEHFLDKNLMLCSGMWAPRTISTVCYIRDRANYLRHFCSCSDNEIETRIMHILQKIILLFEKSMPLNPTYVFCSAYRANFFFNALSDYRKALELCEEVFKKLNFSSIRPTTTYATKGLLFEEFISFPLRNEWCRLYDKYIQIIFGFITLQRTLTTSATVRNRMVPVYISPVLYLKYIYTRD